MIIVSINTLFSSAEIARGTLHGSYGLVFGINTFLAVCLRVIVMKIIEFLELDTGAFNFMGGIMAFVGFTYFVFMLMFTVRTSNPGAVLSRNNNI